MHVGHQSAHVTPRTFNTFSTRAFAKGIQVSLHGFFVLVEMRLIETVNRTFRRNSNIAVRVQKLANFWVKRESIAPEPNVKTSAHMAEKRQ